MGEGGRAGERERRGGIEGGGRGGGEKARSGMSEGGTLWERRAGGGGEERVRWAATPARRAPVFIGKKQTDSSKRHNKADLSQARFGHYWVREPGIESLTSLSQARFRGSEYRQRPFDAVRERANEQARERER